MTKTNKFKDITEEMNNLYEAKNHDYGDSFSKTYEEYGLLALIIRLEDKLNRLKSLEKADISVKTESKRDTLMDIANYAVLGIIELDKEEKNVKTKGQS